MMADETAAEAERAAEAAPFVDAETFGVDASEGTAAADGRPHTLGQVADSHSPDQDLPRGGYLGALGVYAGGAGLLALLARLNGLPVQPPSAWDVLVSAAATHEVNRLVTRGAKPDRAVGWLFTSPPSTRVWAAAGLSAGYVFAPKATRLATAGLAALTGADFLQFARDKLSRPTS